MRARSTQDRNGVTRLNPIARLDEQALVVLVHRDAIARVLNIDHITAV
jgi:hypothetical protein